MQSLSKAGQVDCLVTGNLQPLRDTLVSLAGIYGGKYTVEKQAGANASGVAASSRPAAVVPTGRIVGVNGTGFESDDGEDLMGRITASEKYGEFDDDCNVASSRTFNGKE